MKSGADSPHPVHKWGMDSKVEWSEIFILLYKIPDSSTREKYNPLHLSVVKEIIKGP